MKQRHTADELAHAATLQVYIDKQRAKWEAADIKAGRPPTRRELDERWLWEATIEENSWDRFFGEPVTETD